jgi:hypothetical protein
MSKTVEHAEYYIQKDLSNVLSTLSIFDSSRSFFLKELLPFDPKSKTGNRLMHGICEYDFLLNAAELTFEAIHNFQLDKFDPLVGENACQIRAVLNTLIFTYSSFDTEELLYKVKTSRKTIQDFQETIIAQEHNNFSLEDFIQRTDTNIALKQIEMYLIISYLLTIVKTIKPPKDQTPFVKNEYTDIRKLKSMGLIGTMFAESLVKKLRIDLSTYSVTFIQELSVEKSVHPLSEALTDNFRVIHKQLHSLPCYWFTKILLLKAQDLNIPIVLIARQISSLPGNEALEEVVCFYRNTKNGYKLCEIENLNLNTPCVVLLANSYRNPDEFPSKKLWETELSRYNIFDLVLAYAASHRQYPDISKEDLVKEIFDPEFDHHKKLAFKLGCSIENPYTFFLSHAFCDTPKNLHNHLLYPRKNKKLLNYLLQRPKKSIPSSESNLSEAFASF